MINIAWGLEIHGGMVPSEIGIFNPTNLGERGRNPYVGVVAETGDSYTRLGLVMESFHVTAKSLWVSYRRGVMSLSEGALISHS